MHFKYIIVMSHELFCGYHLWYLICHILWVYWNDNKLLNISTHFIFFSLSNRQKKNWCAFFLPTNCLQSFSSIWMKKRTPNIWRLQSYDTIYYSELDLFFIMSSTVKTSVSRLHLRIIVILRALYFIQPAHEWFRGRFKQRTCLVW